MKKIQAGDVSGQWSVAKGYKREDRRQMAGGKNIKAILPSWLLTTGYLLLE